MLNQVNKLNTINEKFRGHSVWYLLGHHVKNIKK